MAQSGVRNPFAPYSQNWRWFESHREEMEKGKKMVEIIHKAPYEFENEQKQKQQIQ